MQKTKRIHSDLKRLDSMTDADPDAAPDLTVTPGFVKVRGPQKSPTKQQVTMRLSSHVIQHFKQDGEKGWTTRLNEHLEKTIKPSKAASRR